MKKIFMIFFGFLLLVSPLFGVGSSTTVGATVHNYFDYIEILDDIYFHEEDYETTDDNTFRFHLENDSLFIQQRVSSAWTNIFAFDSSDVEFFGDLIINGTLTVDSLITSTVADSDFTVKGDLVVEGTFDAPTVNTGQGDLEVYDILGDLATTSPITGAVNDIFYGTNGDKATIGITVEKDLVTTAPITGGTNDILVGADADITIAITADGIGDTQLAYNTGQHLTTTSDVEHDSLNVTKMAFDSGTDVGEFSTDGTMADNSDSAVPTEKAVKTYVGTEITAEDLDTAGDSGTGAVDLDSQSLTVAGTANETETLASGQTITVGLPDSIHTAKASFDSVYTDQAIIDSAVSGSSSFPSLAFGDGDTGFYE